MADYWVDATDPAADDLGPGSEAVPWESMTKAVATAAASDTVHIKGTGAAYDQVLTPANSGTSEGARITYIQEAGTPAILRRWNLSNRNYITIDGIEISTAHAGITDDTNQSFILTGSDHITIQNFNVHDTHCANDAAFYSQGTKCTWLKIQNGTVRNIGVAYPGGAGRRRGFNITGDNTLIDNVEVDHTEDFTNIFGNRNVIRNPHFHDSYKAETPSGTGHIDGVQSSYGGGNPAQFLLYEGVRHYECPDTDEHSLLINTTDPGETRNIINRFNRFYRVGEACHQMDPNDNGNAHDVVFYNCTIVECGVGYTPKPATQVDNRAVTNSSCRNNIFKDTVRVDDARCYSVSASGSNDGDFNLAYLSSGSITWPSPIGAEANGVRNLDPLFVNESTQDFRLQADSPARGAGGHLTQANGSSGGGPSTTLIVDKACFFQDGWAGVLPDEIAVGSVTNTVAISSINYDTNTITLASAITWSDNDPVWLYKKSDGERVLFGDAPDIGAMPFGEEESAVIPAGRAVLPVMTY